MGNVMRNSITAFAKQEIAGHELAKRSLLSDILTDIKNLTECSSCEVSEVSINCFVDRTPLTDQLVDSIGFA